MSQEPPSKVIYSLKGLDLEKYERDGVDISLLMSTLRKSPTERAETNKALLLFIEEAKKNRERVTDGRHS